MIVVLCGPGGVGKGTIVSELLPRNPRLWLSRSWTTRAPRPGESPDAYVFATREAFEAKIEAGGFLEWVQFLDYLQGSPFPEAHEDQDVLFEIDVVGAQSIRKHYPDALCIYVDAPSREVQAERMRARGDDEQRIAQRLERAEAEQQRAQQLGCAVVINHSVQDSVLEIERLIEATRDAHTQQSSDSPAENSE